MKYRGNFDLDVSIEEFCTAWEQLPLKNKKRHPPVTESKLNILIVEDNQGDFDITSGYLTAGGFVKKIFQANSLSSAIELLNDNHFDVILLDLTLPDATGIQVIQSILKEAQSTPIIILTGYADKSLGLQSLTMGVQDYLAKDEVNTAILLKSIQYSIERVKSRTELIESNRRYQLVSKATNDMVWDWDLTTNITFRSKDGWEKIFGSVNSDEYNNPNAFENRVHPDDVAKTKQFLKTFFKDPDSIKFEHEFRMRRDDGRYAYVIDRGFLVRDAKGKPARLIGALQDITKRKTFEIELAFKESRFRHLVLSGTDIISILDEKGHYTYISPSVKKALGFSEEFLLGKNIFDLIHPDDKRKTISEIKKSNKKGFIEMEPFRHQNSKGNWRWLESKVTNLLNEPSVQGIVINSRDITEKLQEEQEKELLIKELTDSNWDLKQFSFITSHNLRAPLSNLVGILQLLDKSMIKDEETLVLIDGIRRSTLQLEETINDLVEILIIKQNIRPERKKLVLSEEWEKAKNIVKGLIEEVDPVIETDFHEADKLNFHPAYLQSILLNLLSNSLKYRSPKRQLKINITSTFKKEYVVVRFSDNGLGINMDKYSEKVFGLYQRFHTNTDSKGIGLYIIHSQITALGGKIEIESAVDQGTTFIVHFKTVSHDA